MDHGRARGRAACGCCACLSIFAPAEIAGWAGVDCDGFADPDAPPLSRPPATR